jgi:hypothetical protein
MVFYVPVLITKGPSLSGHEYTQRTRSFLYASLATVVARLFGLWRIRFYENGVTSLNLPISAQVVGSRASRTTHPQALQRFSEVFARVFGGTFQVENPFLWKTKSDVVKLIIDSGARDLVRFSVSCTRVLKMSIFKTHCGNYSQCIDRRFATLAAGCTNEDDPSDMYETDLLTGAREALEARTLVESYVRTAKAVDSMPDDEFFHSFPEAYRALEYMPRMNINQAAGAVLDLHRRHARQVLQVITQGIGRLAGELDRLPKSCLVILALPDKAALPLAPEVQTADQLTEPYCRVVRRNRTLTMTKTEYEAFTRRSGSEFDLFLDGPTGKALVKQPNGTFREETLTPVQFGMISEFITSLKVPSVLSRNFTSQK